MVFFHLWMWLRFWRNSQTSAVPAITGPSWSSGCCLSVSAMSWPPGVGLRCRAGSGMITRQYKNLKRLKKGNLRDSVADIYRRLYVNSMIEYLQGERWKKWFTCHLFVSQRNRKKNFFSISLWRLASNVIILPIRSHYLTAELFRLLILKKSPFYMAGTVPARQRCWMPGRGFTVKPSGWV